jgi:hypothetical protein
MAQLSRLNCLSFIAIYSVLFTLLRQLFKVVANDLHICP